MIETSCMTDLDARYSHLLIIISNSDNIPSKLDREPWCSIIGATVTVHQFFCILHRSHDKLLQ